MVLLRLLLPLLMPKGYWDVVREPEKVGLLGLGLVGLGLVGARAWWPWACRAWVGPGLGQVHLPLAQRLRDRWFHQHPLL